MPLGVPSVFPLPFAPQKFLWTRKIRENVQIQLLGVNIRVLQINERFRLDQSWIRSLHK